MQNIKRTNGSNRTESVEPKSGKTVINLQNVGRDFGGKSVLEDISLTIEAGEVFGLLGPSGAGKTTMVNILTGQLKPSRGKAFVLQKEAGMHPAEEGQHFGIMMDHFGLYERLNVYDNLKMYARIFRLPMSKVEEVLEKTRLQSARKTEVQNLSKGMKSRVKLARAVMKEVDILFLDEPTSGLDPSTTEDIHELLMEIRGKGTTIFLTTHNMYEAEKLCDHVALLDQGRIVEYGEPAQICRKYNHLNRIEMHLQNGENIVLPNCPDSAERVKELLEQGQVDAIHSTEPNLEKVFLELTGRGLE